MHTCHYMRFDEHGQVITDIIKDGVRVDFELADAVSAENYKAARARVSQLWHKPTQDELTEEVIPIEVVAVSIKIKFNDDSPEYETRMDIDQKLLDMNVGKEANYLTKELHISVMAIVEAWKMYKEENKK